jgi:hypothetical protein
MGWKFAHARLSLQELDNATPQSNNTCKRYVFLKKYPMNFRMEFEIK